MIAVGLSGVGKVLGGDGGFTISDIDLTFETGRMIAVMGPSGSGKSSLLNLMGLLDSPDRGSITVGGVETTRLGTDERARIRSTSIGFVFQQAYLFSHLNTIDNVAVGARFVYASRRRRYREAREMLDAVGLEHRLTADPSTLSGGERQRVAIARALMADRRILLCDEPTGNLDSVSTEAIVCLLRSRASAGVGVVVVTHDPAVGSRCDETIQLKDGRVSSHS